MSISTMHRVLNDTVDPSLGTLREIAFACGQSLELNTRRVADPAAAASARAALEPGYLPDLPGIELWRARLVRQVGVDDPTALVEAAGKASAPLLRDSTVLLRGAVSFGQIASAGQASEAPWAISGLAGFTMPGLWESTPVPTILWTGNPRRAEQLLAAAMERTSRPHRAHVAICAGEPALFTNGFEQGHVRYAAPIQILLDGYSIGGAAAGLAKREALSW